MIITGIADEAGDQIDAQITATRKLGWKHIEARFVQVEGFEKGSIHEIPVIPSLVLRLPTAWPLCPL